MAFVEQNNLEDELKEGQAVVIVVEGKYQVYEEKLEYDFTKQLMEFLDDALGYNYKELFV